MSKRVETIGIGDDAHSAAKKMREKNISSLLVLESRVGKVNPVGILTERDLVRRICAEGLNSKQVPIQNILSFPLVTIDPRSSIEVAADVMRSNKVRHLLVTDTDRNPLGIVTPSDFTRYLSKLVDLDEVNATILEGILEDDGGPGVA